MLDSINALRADPDVWVYSFRNNNCNNRRFISGKLKKTRTLGVGQVIVFAKKDQGAMTYAKVSGNRKITVSKTTGKVTIRKGLKKGTYSMKVRVKAAGSDNYKPSAWKTVTFKVRVK